MFRSTKTARGKEALRGRVAGHLLEAMGFKGWAMFVRGWVLGLNPKPTFSD